MIPFAFWLIAAALLTANPERSLPTQIAAHLPSVAADRWQPEAQPVVPYKSTVIAEPTTSATGAMIIDAASGTTLYSRNPDKAVPVASVTKVATALVLLKHYQPSDIITVPALPAYGPEDEIIGLKAGQKLTAEAFLEAILIQSANDAADAAAIATSGSTEKFVAEMNQLAETWGIEDVRFSNPTGLTDVGNSASPAAMAKLSQLLLRNELARQIIKEDFAVISTTDGATYSLEATNKLLTSGGFYGIKTGYTVAAGQCFVGVTDIAGHQVITVVFGSNDRFGDTVKLRNWISKSYTWPPSR